MIARPEDLPRRPLTEVIAELHRIETAHGRLDRHADWKPEKPSGALRTLRPAILDTPAKRRAAVGFLGHVGAALVLLAAFAIGSVGVSWLLYGAGNSYMLALDRLVHLTHVPEWVLLPLVPFAAAIWLGRFGRKKPQ